MYNLRNYNVSKIFIRPGKTNQFNYFESQRIHKIFNKFHNLHKEARVKVVSKNLKLRSQAVKEKLFNWYNKTYSYWFYVNYFFESMGATKFKYSIKGLTHSLRFYNLHPFPNQTRKFIKDPRLFWISYVKRNIGESFNCFRNLRLSRNKIIVDYFRMRKFFGIMWPQKLFKNQTKKVVWLPIKSLKIFLNRIDKYFKSKDLLNSQSLLSSQYSEKITAR